MLITTERQPDLTTLKPTDVWVLGEVEPAPAGTEITVTNAGVRLAFRPHKEEQDNGYKSRLQ